MRGFLAVVFSLVVGVGASGQTVRYDYPKLLSRLTDVDWLWSPPAVGERCVQFSSYDRSSDKGPGDVEAWYGNNDRGQYLRVEEKDGKQEFVMVDSDGPGVLARLWSANPSGELFFDIDGERVWTVDFAALCSGKVVGVPEPLAGMRSKGGNCYLPIPFGKHLKVSASKGDFYYQCNVVQFAKGTEVESFRPAWLQQHTAAIVAACAGLHPWGDPAPSAPSVHLPPMQWRIDVPPGSLVQRFTVRLYNQRAEGDPAEDLRKVLLVVRCGGEETVRVPLGDFFAAASRWAAHRGTMLGIDWQAYCRFPMPMPAGGTIELVPEEGVESFSARQGLRLNADVVPRTFAAPPLLFRASYHQQKGIPSRPFRDHLVLDAKGGPGRFVGCSLLVKNPSRAWWGEGDEKFYVDGETFPSTFGTGTEDYFGYAWCSPEPFSSAFHAQTQCDGPGNYGFTSLHRTQLLDSVPFQSSFRFDLEVWHWVEDLKLDYSSVAYWYGAAGATSGLPAVPPAAERTLDRLPPAPVFLAKDALEGEALRVVTATAGQYDAQDLSFRENTFSKDAHLWWRGAKAGDTLVVAVPVAEAGRYKVTVAFTKANDYGIVQSTLDDQKLGEPFDGYATRVESSGPLELATVKLAAGEAKLRFVILGKNDKAKPGYMVGLDYLRLEKVQ